MPDQKPKLVIMPGGAGVPVATLRAALSTWFEATVAQPGVEPSPGSFVLGILDDLSGLMQNPSMAVRQAPLESLASLLNATGEGVCLAQSDGVMLWANDLYMQTPAEVRERLAEMAATAAATMGRERRFWKPSVEAPELPEAARVWRAETDGPSQLGGRRYDVMITPVDPRFGTVVPGVSGDNVQAVAPAGAGVSGVPRAVAVVVRDVTSAHKLRQRMDAIDLAGSDLVQIETSAVREKNMIERLGLLESRIVSAAKELLHFDHFAVRILDEKTGKLELVIKHNLPAEYDAFDIYPRPEGNGTSGWVAATGKSYVCKDAVADELFLPGLHGARSSLTVPLKFHDRVVGIMNIESQRPAAFDDDDRRLAEIFARYIAMAVHTLDLLVVERAMTNRAITVRFEGEIDEPLKDISNEVEVLRAVAAGNIDLIPHIDKIRTDVEAIRQRIQDVADGPTTLLGAQAAMDRKTIDPALLGKRILVADDQSKIRRIIGDVLRNRGCEATVCEHGGEALREVARVAAKEIPPFDLLVSDIMMPEANGYEVFSAAREAMPTIAVILMTGFGYDPNHSIVRASQEGLQSVLFKPFQVEQLVDAVKRALKGPG